MQDLFSRRIVGWAMADHLRAELVVDALRWRSARRRPDAGLVHHSDQGCQYTAVVFTARCAEAGITYRPGSKGDCFDNAVCESFHASLKKELIYRHPWPTRAQARTAIFEYIEGWYNPRRRHSTLGYLSPVDIRAPAPKPASHDDARHPVAQHPSHRMSSPHRQPPPGTPGARRARIFLAPPTAPRGISGTSHTLHQVNPCPRERGRATTPLRAMLADRQTYRWEIEHLPCLLALKLPVTEIATTILTARRDIPDDLIRVLHSLRDNDPDDRAARQVCGPTGDASFSVPAALKVHPRTAAATSYASLPPDAPSTPRPPPATPRSTPPARQQGPQDPHTTGAPGTHNNVRGPAATPCPTT